jgi:hypothetical protein
MRKAKMSDKALTEALSKSPDWKSARRRTTVVEPIVEGPSYLNGPDAIVKIKGQTYAIDIKTAPANPSFAQLKSYADINFKEPGGRQPWGVCWEEKAREGGHDSLRFLRERRFRTVMARDSWIQLISEKPYFIRFISFEDPKGDPS